MKKIVILTSISNRHKFFVNYLSNFFEVLGVVSEEKRPNQTSEVAEENKILSDHFIERNVTENKYFADDKDFKLPLDKILIVKNGESNSSFVFDWAREKNPELVVLFGTSIIKEPLLSFFNNRIINIHLGLSPYYRGSGTNFWPLVNGVPECVGATIHLAVLKVDAGPILAQVRPDIVIGDTCHDFGCKTIISGAKKMAQCINLYSPGKVFPVVQNLAGGLLYKRKDFNAGAVKQMKENFESGMIEKYLVDKIERDSKYPIINI